MMIILNTFMLNVTYILIPLQSGINGMGLSSVGSYPRLGVMVILLYPSAKR
jgi:hypothetical protein